MEYEASLWKIGRSGPLRNEGIPAVEELVGLLVHEDLCSTRLGYRFVSVSACRP